MCCVSFAKTRRPRTTLRRRIGAGDTMKSRAITEDAAKKKREALEFARGARFWLNLRSSLDECRAHGIPLAEAKRRLEARLVAEGHGSKKAPRRRAAH